MLEQNHSSRLFENYFKNAKQVIREKILDEFHLPSSNVVGLNKQTFINISNL
jgi:hypothetical protein